MTQPATSHAVSIGVAGGSVSGLVQSVPNQAHLLVLAHGAGAGMRHPFLEAIALGLSRRRIATLRYQFPYMEAGRKRTDSPEVAQAVVRAAVGVAAKAAPNATLLAGGKSFGGRMTSQAQADNPLPGVRGLVFLGFPLHPPGKPGISRADHLSRVQVPMLFLQGTRDDFARLDLITEVCGGLGALATLELIDGADHSFNVRKSAAQTSDQVLDGLCETVTRWSASLTRGG